MIVFQLASSIHGTRGWAQLTYAQRSGSHCYSGGACLCIGRLWSVRLDARALPASERNIYPHFFSGLENRISATRVAGGVEKSDWLAPATIEFGVNKTNKQTATTLCLSILLLHLLYYTSMICLAISTQIAISSFAMRRRAPTPVISHPSVSLFGFGCCVTDQIMSSIRAIGNLVILNH